MKRRDFLASMVVAGAAAPAMAAQDQGHAHDPLDGPLANATVSFGQWRFGQDRVAVNPPPPPANGHAVLPFTATVKAGGAVNFIIAGLHQIVVYGPGKQPGDVNLDPATFLPDPTPGPPPFPPLINDPELRVYRGPATAVPPGRSRRGRALSEPGLAPRDLRDRAALRKRQHVRLGEGAAVRTAQPG
jgi:hypothetical protein